MNQILAIFKKDARHLWPEILLYFGILIGFVAAEAAAWPNFRAERPQNARDLSALMNVLLPLAWSLLIARAVQDERLVGDRAFWLTRPFGWQRILTAKLAFITIFVALPLFVAKAALLHIAGMSWSANTPLLLANTSMSVLVIFLPLYAVASVTANIVRMFFVVVVLCLFVGLAVYLNSFFPFPWMTVLGLDPTPFWILPLAICVCASVILLQYSRRRTTTSRIILIVLCLAVVLIISISEHTWNLSRLYKEQTPGESLPLTLVLNPDRSLLGAPPDVIDFEGSQTDHRTYRLSIPLLLSDVAPNHTVHFDHVSISYKNPLSGELSAYQEPLGYNAYPPGKFSVAIGVPMKGDVFRRLMDKPLTVELAIALTEFEAIGSASSMVANADFSLPNQGICHPPDLLDSEHDNTQLALYYCQFPVQSLPRTFVTTRLSNFPCAQQSLSREDASGWIGSDQSWGWPLAFDPVELVPIFVTGRELGREKGVFPRSICPGTLVKFTNFRVVRRRLVHITLPSILPRDYTKIQEGQIGR